MTEPGPAVLISSDVTAHQDKQLQVATTQRAPLLNNDVVINVQQGVRGAAALASLPPRVPVNLAFSNLVYSIRDRATKECKTLLHGLSGEFRAGELTAVMGPSGAGKSTLLNLLAGYRTGGVREGEVRVNGRPREARRFRKLSCYIMQDSELLPHLTVLEALQVAASLKLGQRAAPTQRRLIVQEVLSALGLVECGNTLTSKLSGGQRKRLAIAQELVSNPPVMFFDEPTSGLDSTSCHHCISLLKSLAQGGRMIVCSIHQPSARIFEMFDQLYVLAAGQCIYRGAVDGLVPFLSAAGLQCPTYHNPADFVMEVASGEHGDVLARLVSAVPRVKCDDSNDYTPSFHINCSNKGPDHEKGCLECLQAPELLVSALKRVRGRRVPVEVVDCEELGDSETFPTSGWTQFRVLLRRTVLCTFRDPTLTQLRLASHVLVGLLIGLIYFRIGNDASKVFNNAGFLMVCVLFLMFCAMMPTILTFPLERAVFEREYLNHWYSLKSFYFAKTIADIPFQVTYTILYLLIAYFLTEQPAELFRLLLVLLMGVLTSLVAQSIGLLIGAAVRLENGVVLGPTVSLPMTMFAGFFVTFSTIPAYLRWLSWVSYIRYGLEGTIVAVYGFGRAKLECSQLYCHFRNPVKFLEELEMADANVWVDAIALLVCFLVVKILTYIFLRWRLRHWR